MSKTSDVMLLGATGLVGSLALPLLLERAKRENFIVHVPTRRALDLQHDKLRAIHGDLESEQSLALVDRVLADDGVQLEAFVCALGSTMKQAGSEAAFAAIDRDLVLKLALIAHRHGARQAVVVSSVGANAASPNFYLRVKGEMETGIVALGYERADFLHPGLLLGHRGAERRGGERVAQALAPLYNPLLFGPLRRFRAIRADKVAAAMATLVGRQGTGVMMLTNPSIEDMARGR